MRSRFAAFALGLDAYLIRTLSSAHPDRAVPEPALLRQLAASREKRRFLDLCILHTSAEGDTGEVLFFARIFERGQDRSFAELSSFEREDGGWRYASGLMVPRESLPADPKTLTRATFLALAPRP
jgi:SEC-C motif-containing protein